MIGTCLVSVCPGLINSWLRSRVWLDSGCFWRAYWDGGFSVSGVKPCSWVAAKGSPSPSKEVINQTDIDMTRRRSHWRAIYARNSIRCPDPEPGACAGHRFGALPAQPARLRPPEIWPWVITYALVQGFDPQPSGCGQLKWGLLVKLIEAKGYPDWGLVFLGTPKAQLPLLGARPAKRETRPFETPMRNQSFLMHIKWAWWFAWVGPLWLDGIGGSICPDSSSSSS